MSIQLRYNFSITLRTMCPQFLIPALIQFDIKMTVKMNDN